MKCQVLISFIDRDDSNITRCTVCSWWARFVDELEVVRLVARCVVQHTVEQIHKNRYITGWKHRWALLWLSS